MAFMSRDVYILKLRAVAAFLAANPDVPVPLLRADEPEKLLPLAYLSDEDDDGERLALERLIRAVDGLPHTVALDSTGEDIDVRFDVSDKVFYQVVIGARLAKSAGLSIESHLVVDGEKR